jgi:hypothetical protein
MDACSRIGRQFSRANRQRVAFVTRKEMSMVGRIFVLLTLLTVVAGCATTPPTNTASMAAGWTDSLAPLGFDGRVDALEAPRPWRVSQVAHCSHGDVIQVGMLDEQQATDEGTVLADLTGPGCITRLWAANPSGNLHIYIDDAPEPALALPFAHLFNSMLEPFMPPLAGQAGGAGYSYVPIPYRQRCRVVLADAQPGLCYEIAYAQLPPETPIQPFSFKLNRHDKEFFRRWRDAWSNAADVRFVDRKTERYHNSGRSLWPEEDVQIWVIEGPATITELQMSFKAKDPEILHKVWLAIYWDDQPEPSVLAPVGDFFGDAATGGAPHATAALGTSGDMLFCRYPMPFQRLAQIRLINASDSKIDFKYDITWRPGPPRVASWTDAQIQTDLDGDGVAESLPFHAPAGYFHARYNGGMPAPGQPYTAARVQGAGQVVGCTFAATSDESLAFLDGGAFLLLDNGQSGPYQSGAIGHFFNAGADFGGTTFQTPSHGCTALTAPPTPAAAAYRSMVSDPAPFNNSFSLLFEQGPQNARPATFMSVVYWYQQTLGPAPWSIPGFAEPIHVRGESYR